MIYLRRGDIITTPLDNIVIPVNLEGRIERGIGHHIAAEQPEFATVLSTLVGKMYIGDPIYWFKPVTGIIMIPITEKAGGPTELETIVEAFLHIFERRFRYGIRSMAIPKIGCGTGGLEWRIVKSMIYEIFDGQSILIELYE